MAGFHNPTFELPFGIGKRGKGRGVRRKLRPPRAGSGKEPAPKGPPASGGSPSTTAAAAAAKSGVKANSATVQTPKGPSSASAAAAPSATLWGRFNEGWNGIVKGWREGVQSMKSKKWEMPVHVDVDFFKPTITAIRDTAQETWMKLPPPVRQVAPYVGVGLLVGAAVQNFNDRRVLKEQNKNDELQAQLVSLLKENKELDTKIRDLQSEALRSPRSAAEAKLVAAVAQATNAAAAAADAAAAAATSCAIRVRKIQPPENSPQRSPAGRSKT